MSHSQLKIIWEFRGGDALETANHHKVHLEDYFRTKKVTHFGIGVEEVSNAYAVAFVIIDRALLQEIKNDLKPHRAFLHAS